MTKSDRSAIARTALRGTVWVTLGNYAHQIIGFAALLYLRRLLDPDIFGWLDVAMFWVTLLSVRGKFGLGYAALRQPKTDGRLLGTCFALDLAAGALTLLLCLAAIAPLTAVFGYSDIIRLAITALAVSEFLAVFGNVFAIALEKELQFSRNQLVTLAAYTVAYATAIGLALAGYRLTSLLSIGFVTAIVGATFAIVMYARRLPHLLRERWRVDASMAQSLIRDGLSTGLTLALMTTIVGQFDNFLNATYVSATTQGYYGNAYKIANWPSLLLAAVIARVGYNVMARVKDDPDRLAHTVRLAIWVLAMFAAPIALTISLGASDIVEMLYPGGKWAPSVPFLRPLALTGLASLFMSVAYWLSVAQGQRRFTATLALTQAACLLIGGSVLVRIYGATGTLISVAMASTAGLSLALGYIHRRVSVNLVHELIMPVLGALCAAGLYQIVPWANLADVPAFARSALTAALVFAVFWAVVLIFRRNATVSQLRYLAQTWRGVPAG